MVILLILLTYEHFEHNTQPFKKPRNSYSNQTIEIISELFINERAHFFSPCRDFLFLVMLFLWMCVHEGPHKSVVVEVRHVWLRDEIYQHNNVVILNIKFNVCCNTMHIRWFLSAIWWIVIGPVVKKKRRWKKTTVLSFPKEEHLWKIWIKFVYRKDWEPTNSSCICIKHFEDKYYQKGEGNKRFRLIAKNIETCTNDIWSK